MKSKMNLTKDYIKEIQSVEESDVQDVVVFELTVSNHGNITRKRTSFLIDKWEEAKEQGYYLT